MILNFIRNFILYHTDYMVKLNWILSNKVTLVNYMHDSTSGKAKHLH